MLRRKLVNGVRAKVAEQMGCHSWSDIARENRFQLVVQALTAIQEKPPLKDYEIEASIEEVASFLIDDVDGEYSWEQDWTIFFVYTFG